MEIIKIPLKNDFACLSIMLQVWPERGKWIYVDYPHIVHIEGQTLNAQLFMGETAGHIGTE